MTVRPLCRSIQPTTCTSPAEGSYRFAKHLLLSQAVLADPDPAASMGNVLSSAKLRSAFSIVLLGFGKMRNRPAPGSTFVKVLKP